MKTGLFGAVLDTIDPKYIDNNTGVPIIVESIFSQIEKSGITTHNIFHSTGDISNIKRLEVIFSSGRTEDLQLYEEHTHDLCGLVLHYLQRLPEPLCTLFLYSDFLEYHSLYYYKNPL